MDTSGYRVLVIDDEMEIRRLLKVALGAHGFSVVEATSGQEGLQGVLMNRPDLIILDLGLPDKDGLELIQQIREWSAVPIVILSARENEAEKVKALDAGADDYVTKPFGMGEFLARLRTALRHSQRNPDEPVLSFDDLVIDRATRLVTVGGREIKLTPTEYELVKTLASNAGKVLTHRQLLRAVWGPHQDDQTHYLRIYVAQLRRKLEVDATRPRHIVTEPGVGYRLI